MSEVRTRSQAPPGNGMLLEAPPPVGSVGGRASYPVRSQAEPGNEK